MSTKVTVAGTIFSERKTRPAGQPRIGDADDADVGLDRGERVVRREHAVAGQGVEQGGLADIGQTDDADGEGHGASRVGGRAGPPREEARRRDPRARRHEKVRLDARRTSRAPRPPPPWAGQ